VKDSNFRIFTDRTIVSLNNAVSSAAPTPEIFDQLGVEDASHAFYPGKELMAARDPRERPPAEGRWLGLPDSAGGNPRRSTRLTQRGGAGGRASG
jgi:hypothetical protein